MREGDEKLIDQQNSGLTIMSLLKNKNLACSTLLDGESPGQSSPPSPDDEMDPEVRMDLKFILKKNLKEIITTYATYVDTVRVLVEKIGVSPEELRSYLLSLPATSKSSRGQELTLLSDKETELKRCDTIIEIFNYLKTKCASFLTYDIFQCTLKYYNISEDQERLRYPEHLNAYIEKHKISEFASINPLLKHKKGSKELTLKFDIKNTCKLAQVDELKNVIAEIMDLNPSALELVDIEDGCVIVTFLIPASVADAIFTANTVFTSQQEDELRAASVLWLKCNGYTFHFGKTIVYTESPGTDTYVSLIKLL